MSARIFLLMKTPFILRLPIAFALFWLLGAGPVVGDDKPVNTPSNRPEVTIAGSSLKKIQDAAAKFFKGRDYVEKFRSDAELVYQKPYKKPAAPPGTTQCLRIRIKISKEKDNAFKVMGLSYGVDDCGLNNESETPTPSAYPQIQGFLETIKKSAGGK